ncbi:MAG: serine/threonine protein kinase [Oscillospiraceae bacterium]|nr:serine/threonine protein kinase [Oscillospiraceae bacterium]
MKSRLRLGVLKEFYPIEVENLKRNENNQLIYCGENTEKSEFIKRLKSFIQPYNMLLKVRNQLDLATFISHFEMYHTDNNNGTIYIWTPVSELETFESLCNSINNNPSENSEHQLLTAMNAVKELLKCVCSLHKAELLNGDIKPSNFGFQKRGDEILVETIQMFDVDTICSVYEISEKISFSKGFDAPEPYETGISNLTDIYAIGATLFNAVIVTSETASDDFLYSPSFFDKIENLVNESELLNSCSDMIHPKFRGLLTEILKKSLCGTKERYQSCEEMLEDVTSAIYYITPFANSNGERYVFTDVEQLLDRFVPIFESQQYRNYKLDDLELIEGIPFILTYSSELYMAIPFVTGSNNDVFSNIAAAITVNPYKIVFLASCLKRTEVEAVKKALPYISEFMLKKKLRASINFIIECTSGLNVSDAEKTEKEFSQLSSKRVQNVRFINSEYGTEYMEYIEEYIDRQLKKGHKFIIEKNSSPVSRMMGLVGMYKRYPTYSFNSSNSSFNNINACSAIEYIRFKPYLTVSDMFAFNLSTSTTSNKPEFYEEYNELWRQYKQYTAEWKQMCKCFKDYSDEKDVIAVFSRKNTPHNIYEYTYIIPFLCKEAVSKILDALISQNIIADDSYIAVRNTGSCKVVIKDIYGSRVIYDSLISELYKLMQPDYIKCEINPKDHVIKICYNNLSAYNVDCKKLNAKGYELIKFLHEKKYLINLSIERNTGTITFTYATPQIKELLTSEGKLLEVYVYHKAKETGKYNDIRSGFEINWENDVASNEFNCVLTKGLNSLFIECKATNNLRSDYYTKLYALADKFGINATVVLIADTLDNDNTGAINEKMRKTGEGFDIITLSDRADIDNIGEKLLGILKKRIE